MSTVVVVKKKGVAAIGADTLTKLGYTNERKQYIYNYSKLLRFGGNYFAFVGHASWDLVLKSYFNKVKPALSLASPQEIFEFIRELHISLKDDYFLNPKEEDDDPFESSQVDLLIANKSGIFGLHRFRSVSAYKKFYAFGSGYKFALGAMRAVYDSASSAKALAKAGLEAACDFDDGSGLPFEIKTVQLNK